MKGRFLANVSNKEMEGAFVIISHPFFISEIFPILLVTKSH